jgi:site-specific DNA recombinase
MKRAALYARVSTARQEQEETIDSQIAEVKQRILLDENILLESNVYIDEGYSGSLLERPALDAMLDAAKSEDFDVVYIYDLGRLSRVLSHLLVVIEQLEKYEREIISLHEKITGTPEDKFLLQIMGSMHEYERAKIAERFRRGKMYKARSGKIVGYSAPYGYVYNKESGEFEVNEIQSEVVRKMYEWVANEGLSTYSVIKRLHEQGIVPPKKKSEYWSRSPVSRILSNETYFGRHHYNRTESILPRNPQKASSKYRKIQKTGRRRRAREEWIEFEVPAIISKELFDKARKQLERNSVFNPKNRKHQYLLTGLVKCTCGANRNGDGPEGKKYYRCISRHRYFDRKTRCKVGGLNVKVLDSLVWQKVALLLSDPEQLRIHAERWLNQQKGNETVNDTTRLEKQLKELENEQKRYVDAYGKGLIPEQIFAAKIRETSKQKASVETDIVKTSSNRGVIGKIDIEQLISKATRKIAELNFEQKKHIVERVVDKVIASPKEVTIWGQIPVPAFARATTGKVNYGSQHRDCRPAECWQEYAF